MNKAANILIVGVGGQGTVLASRIISQAAQLSGYDVKQSEVHGMAQRGGSVVSYVRFADKIFSPMVEIGQADMIIAFEKLEALRWSDYLQSKGIMIVNEQEIPPVSGMTGTVSYPGDILKTLSSYCQTITVNAIGMAIKLGEPRTVNSILLGTALKKLGFERSIGEKAVIKSVPGRTVEVNLRALSLGWDLI
ncbi:hypothetical protein P22_0314 [Propionispora sp. 2/2-37]|uniref:indolepyruvate oxidoreductase subunit beta n=1 Tax=Propionispora sp. 2/2-37 TaxID=1677858 RepID=UPI0006BB5FD0|nr:indolepyruvate oxidoreductase subunit beta [Propionispora sp. 2/2-37]CUH94248.1 hypothetical protein P22_0314 [Propionispora sp. 2/2-37]